MGCVIRVLQFSVHRCKVCFYYQYDFLLHISRCGINKDSSYLTLILAPTIFMSLLVLRYYREVLPGEIVQISKHGIKSLSVVPRPEGDLPAFCIFEYVYFARPDSIFEGMNKLTCITISNTLPLIELLKYLK